MQTRKLLGEMIFKTQEFTLNRDNTRTAQEDKNESSATTGNQTQSYWLQLSSLLQYLKAIYTLPKPKKEDSLHVLCCK